MKFIFLAELLWATGCGVTTAPLTSSVSAGGTGTTGIGTTSTVSNVGPCSAASSSSYISPRADAYNVANFSGADASVCINSCLAAVTQMGGGVCDASAFGGTQSMSQEIELGNGITPANSVALTLLLPDTATWVWNLTDGKSCGIRQYSMTALLGAQPGGAGNRMLLTASPGASMDSLYCTDDADGVVTFVRAEGFAAANSSSTAQFAAGLIDLRNLGTMSAFARIYAGNDYGDAWHISSACCGAEVSEVTGAGGGTASTQGTPLTIGPGVVSGVSIAGSSFSTPAPGEPNISIQGSNQTMGVQFYSVHLSGTGADTSPMVYIGPGVGAIHFIGGLADLNLTQGAPLQTGAIFENHGYKLGVSGFDVIGSSSGINDVTAGVQIPVRLLDSGFGEIPPYTTGGPARALHSNSKNPFTTVGFTRF